MAKANAGGGKDYDVRANRRDKTATTRRMATSRRRIRGRALGQAGRASKAKAAEKRLQDGDRPAHGAQRRDEGGGG